MNRTTAPRRGLTLLNSIMVIACLMFVLYFAMAGLNASVTNRRQDTCRSNLNNLALAAIMYGARNGKLPGYANCLVNDVGEAYRDPDSGELSPVSWCVELLADLDRGALYEMWRSSGRVGPAGRAIVELPASAAPAATDPAAAPRATTAPPQRANVKVYLEILTCPNVERNDRTGTPLNYVVNTGLPDLPASKQANAGENGAAATVGFPRDWQANGMFFDNYSDDKRIKPDAKTRGPQIVMRLAGNRDPKDKTILITENLDATSYVFDKKLVPDGNPALAEVIWGTVWAPGKSSPNPDEATHAQRGKLILEPRDDVSAPNALNDGKAHPPGYKYCRPSSPHAGGFNVAFAAKNVQFVNDKISYYIYAKLMASDDAAAKLPGTMTRVDLGTGQDDVELNP